MPVCFVWLLVPLKNAANTDSATINEDLTQEVTIPFSFQDYATAIRAERICLPGQDVGGFDCSEFEGTPFEEDCQNEIDNLKNRISGMTFGGVGWAVPFVKCDATRCQEDYEDAKKYCEYSKLAVSYVNGGKDRAEAFQQYVRLVYPDVTQTLLYFENANRINDYVRDRKYGRADFPSIALAVVFDGDDPSDWKYTIRQNSTNYNSPQQEGGRPAIKTTPDTSRTTEAFARSDTSVCEVEGGGPELGHLQDSCTGLYMYNGVLTIQRLVNDFIMNQTGTHEAGYRIAENGVRFAPFPERSYETENFWSSSEGKLCKLV